MRIGLYLGIALSAISFATSAVHAQRARDATISEMDPYIVGGQPVENLSERPWQVALVRSNSRNQFCGGSLVAKEWVLTAAHCVDAAIIGRKPENLDVVLGTLQFASGGEQIGVAEIHVHPSWNASTMDHDAALLRLRRPSSQGVAIKLHDAADTLPNGTPVTVSGWGAIAWTGPKSQNLLYVEVPVVQNNICNKPESYNGQITDSMFCAGEREGGKDSCQGDSGGPNDLKLNGTDTLVGIVSWGDGCALRLKYGVYTRVNKIAPWAKQKIGLQ